MLELARTQVEANRIVLMSAFVSAIANGLADFPGTLALAQLGAEVLRGIAYMQFYKPSTECIIGQSTLSTSPRSGAPMAGVPEIALINSDAEQVARNFGLPRRTTGAQANPNAFGAQPGYESAPRIYAAFWRGPIVSCASVDGTRQG